MNSHNNARLTPKGREQMVRAVVDNATSIVILALVVLGTGEFTSGSG